MQRFIIESLLRWYNNPRTGISESGSFVSRNIDAFYHADYVSAGKWREEGTIENLIWTFKNDVSPFPERLNNAKLRLVQILRSDLPLIRNTLGLSKATVCVVPRAKKEISYRSDQLLFRDTIDQVLRGLGPNFENGSRYIIRHTDTRTTHLNRNGEGGNGHLPYPGITIDTCTISNAVQGKDIILIDDLYTETINVDEDAIQALIRNNAKSVYFYSIGKTKSRTSIEQFNKLNTNQIDDLPF